MVVARKVDRSSDPECTKYSGITIATFTIEGLVSIYFFNTIGLS